MSSSTFICHQSLLQVFVTFCKIPYIKGCLLVISWIFYSSFNILFPSSCFNPFCGLVFLLQRTIMSSQWFLACEYDGICFVVFRGFLGFVNNIECCNMQQNIGWLWYWLMNIVVVVGFFCSTNNKQCHKANDDFFGSKCWLNMFICFSFLCYFLLLYKK